MARRPCRPGIVVATVVLGLLAGVGGCSAATPAATGEGEGSASADPVVSSPSSRTVAAAARGVLVVRVTLTGGPMRPDGTMALNRSPAPDVRVVATGPATADAVTDASGVARLTLRPGTYRLRTGYGSDRVVRVVAGEQRLDLDVPIP